MAIEETALTTELERLPEFGERVRFTHAISRTSDWKPGVDRRAWLPYAHEADGIVIGWRTLSNGTVEAMKESNGYGGWVSVGTEYCGAEYFRAYLVAYDMRSKPVFVLPEHLQRSRDGKRGSE